MGGISIGRWRDNASRIIMTENDFFCRWNLTQILRICAWERVRNGEELKEKICDWIPLLIFHTYFFLLLRHAFQQNFHSYLSYKANMSHRFLSFRFKERFMLQGSFLSFNFALNWQSIKKKIIFHSTVHSPIHCCSCYDPGMIFILFITRKKKVSPFLAFIAEWNSKRQQMILNWNFGNLILWRNFFCRLSIVAPRRGTMRQSCRVRINKCENSNQIFSVTSLKNNNFRHYFVISLNTKLNQTDFAFVSSLFHFSSCWIKAEKPGKFHQPLQLKQKSYSLLTFEEKSRKLVFNVQVFVRKKIEKLSTNS